MANLRIITAPLVQRFPNRSGGYFAASDEPHINVGARPPCGTNTPHPPCPPMSRAFVKEPDGETFEELPDRPISEHPNLVTPQGLAQIEETLTRLHAEHARAQASGERAALARIGRDLRYWTARRSSARLMPAPAGHDRVRFGSSVTIARA